MNAVAGVGFGLRSRREVKLWDLANTSKPLGVWQKEASGSVLMPHMDHDNNILYLFGKGDGSVEWLTIGGTKVIKSIGIYRNSEPQKGGCWVPKAGLDVMECEAARFMKLTNKSLIPLSFIVPRKAKQTFQEDIFQPTYGGIPNLTMEEYWAGEDREIKRMSLDPKDRQTGHTVAKLEVKMSYKELEGECEKLRARVQELEAKLGIESTGVTEEKEA